MARTARGGTSSPQEVSGRRSCEERSREKKHLECRTFRWESHENRVSLGRTQLVWADQALAAAGRGNGLGAPRCGVLDNSDIFSNCFLSLLCDFASYASGSVSTLAAREAPAIPWVEGGAWNRRLEPLFSVARVSHVVQLELRLFCVWLEKGGKVI